MGEGPNVRVVNVVDRKQVVQATLLKRSYLGGLDVMGAKLAWTGPCQVVDLESDPIGVGCSGCTRVGHRWIERHGN